MRRPHLTTVLAVLMAGCGTQPPSSGTVVRGQVFYRGEPLSGGLVVFTPDSTRGSDGPTLSAAVQPDGTFTLTTDEGKPIAAGWYRVSVAPSAGTVDVPTAELPYPGLPARYRNPARSGLDREVKAGADNFFLFDLAD
jgi:hypothetical protein